MGLGRSRCTGGRACLLNSCVLACMHAFTWKAGQSEWGHRDAWEAGLACLTLAFMRAWMHSLGRLVSRSGAIKMDRRPGLLAYCIHACMHAFTWKAGQSERGHQDGQEAGLACLSHSCVHACIHLEGAKMGLGPSRCAGGRACLLNSIIYFMNASMHSLGRCANGIGAIKMHGRPGLFA